MPKSTHPRCPSTTVFRVVSPCGGAGARCGEVGAVAPRPEAGAWADGLRAGRLIAADTDAAAPLGFEHGRVALRRYARYEQRLADALRTRRDVLTEAADDAQLARLFALQPGTPDRQALAAWTVLRQRLTLVRSEERRVGEERVRSCSSRWSPNH